MESEPKEAQTEATGHRQAYVTISFDRQGRIMEVLDRRQAVVRGKEYQEPTKGEKCPEGEQEITAVETTEVVYVTCADTKDPCWVYNPVTKRWYRIC